MVKQKKKDLVFVLIFIVIVSGALLYLFGVSYAKYRKMIKGEVDAEIASWRIKINNEDISKKKVLSNKIKPVFVGDEFTKPGVLAPGSVGYFDIVIDSSDVDVNFNYVIDVENSSDSSIKDLKIISYVINPTNGRETPTPYKMSISDDIRFDTTLTTIRFNIEWDDSEEATMDNEADTNVAGDSNSKAVIDVNIKLNQINQ